MIPHVLEPTHFPVPTGMDRSVSNVMVEVMVDVGVVLTMDVITVIILSVNIP